MAGTRERQLVEAFVSLADTMVVGYDVVELLHTLVERSRDLLDAADAGIILADPDGSLEVIASTSERSRLIGLMQLGADEGPCVESYATGEVVRIADIESIRERWPHFAAEAEALGYASVHAVPLRLRERTIGSLNLFRDRPGELGDDDAVAARALADVATISILQERSLRESDVAREQLQHALTSRVVIEQAKGVLAQTRNIDMEEAFRQLRLQARSTNTRLSELARSIVEDAAAPHDGASAR